MSERDIIARTTDHHLWDRGVAIPNVESEQALADAQHDSLARADDVIAALTAAGFAIVGTALTYEQSQLVIKAVDWQVSAPDGDLDPDDIVSIFQAGMIAIHKSMIAGTGK